MDSLKNKDVRLITHAALGIIRTILLFGIVTGIDLNDQLTNLITAESSFEPDIALWPSA